VRESSWFAWQGEVGSQRAAFPTKANATQLSTNMSSCPPEF
jgi:hypothetical protein